MRVLEEERLRLAGALAIGLQGAGASFKEGLPGRLEAAEANIQPRGRSAA